MGLYKEVIIAYDVSNDQRRNKLYEALLDIGLKPIQKSVFWGKITEAEYKAIARLFKMLLAIKTDRGFIVKANFTEQLEQGSFGYDDLNMFAGREYAVL